jgi:hypothetical protein
MNTLNLNLKFIFFATILLFSNLSFGNDEKDYSYNIENRINSIVEQYGYKFTMLQNDELGKWNSIKAKVKLFEYPKSRIIPPIKHIIIDENMQYFFMLFDTHQGKKEYSNFRNIKHSLSKFKKSEYSRLMIFSMPVHGSIPKTLTDTEHYMTTNYSIIVNDSSKSHLGTLYERNGEVFNNITKQVVNAKKDREKFIIEKIYNEYNELIISADIIDLKKIIVILFSETCGYCKKMIRESELYTNKGYSLIPLPATTLYFDEKYKQSTYKYFCGNIQENFKKLTPSNNCDMEYIENIFDLKKHLLGGVEYRGTPTLYLTEYGLWYSGYMGANQL